MNNCKVIAVTNQKGGVGKTTTTLSLGVALSKLGKKVLLVDADPQGDLTTYMGWYNQYDIPVTISELMEYEINDKSINSKDAILHHKENIDLIPSNLDFSTMEMKLINAMNREQIMKRCIENLKKDYDYIIIDCMPSLGMITVNALTSADKVIISVQTQYLAVKNMGHLLKTISNVKKHLNHKLDIGGVLLTLVYNRTNLAKEIKEEFAAKVGSSLVYINQLENIKRNTSLEMLDKLVDGINNNIDSNLNITSSDLLKYDENHITNYTRIDEVNLH